jgi:selenocysteine-specific elongation factor
MLAVEPKGLTLAQILARTGWTESETREAGAQLEKSGKLRVIEKQPLIVVSAEAMATCIDEVRKEIERFHKSNPLLPGIPKEALRSKIAPVRPELFRTALEELANAKVIATSGDLVRLAGREIALSPEEAKAKEQIEREFERAGLTVPHWEEILAKLPVEAQRARKILQILLREKVLIKVTEDLVFHQKAMARLRELLGTYRQQRGERLPIPAFKELTGITRKYAIPLLEYLDRERVTRRVGDERVIL